MRTSGGKRSWESSTILSNTSPISWSERQAMSETVVLIQAHMAGRENSVRGVEREKSLDARFPLTYKIGDIPCRLDESRGVCRV